MVGVIVGDQDVINPGDTCFFADFDDTAGVASVVAGKAGVDQQIFAGGRDEEGGLSAIDIGEVDAEGGIVLVGGRRPWFALLR